MQTEAAENVAFATLGFNIVLTDLVIGLDDLGRPLWLRYSLTC
jgi:hypothetical protein